MAKPFKSVQALHPGRSVFDLSYSKLFTCDMGQLIPVCCDEIVPGDKFKIGAEAVLRFQPLVAPVLHEINMYCHYFFVPYRILFNEELGDTGSWESFITGGPDGTSADVLPRWSIAYWDTCCVVGSLWDYLGFPTDVLTHIAPGDESYMPLDFPRRAYYKIFNDFYRDETHQAELDITDDALVNILNRAWTKDYFTSALPWQQRGTAPALPLSGTSQVEWSDTPTPVLVSVGGGGSVAANYSIAAAGEPGLVDFSNAATFDVADLRLAFQIQKWMERNARAGARYTSFLHSHFGVSPKDERLMRPEYIGGFKAPVIVSEVLQTSKTETGAPQGNMAGHGISAVSQYCGEYFAEEYGLIMGIMSVMPKPMYHQGINRQWLRETKYDFYFPEFANLSEQMVTKEEICFNEDDPTLNGAEFGFQGRYDEMRYKPNQVCALMRPGVTDSLAHWNLCRDFDETDPPDLDEDFIECVPDKRIFAVTAQPGLIVSYANLIKAIRPLPISAEPGLIDHS